MMRTITGPILDSSGRPASGQIRARATHPFNLPSGLVTEAVSIATVIGGEPYVDGDPWMLPATPEGVYIVLEQDLDGEQIQTFTVYVPENAEEESPNLSYTDLVFNRGVGATTAAIYWWDLTGGIEFPETALPGDYGYDSDTGNVWRNV